MKPPAVIFDRDGTLASVAYCLPATGTDAAWAEYNAALPFDAPIPSVCGLLRAIRPGVTRIMVSGRREGDWAGDRRRRWRMQDWIVKHQLPIDWLLMRAGGDYRIDSEVKAQMYREQIAPLYTVRYVVDDRPQVIDMWRQLGLPVLPVVDPGIEPPIARQGSRYIVWRQFAMRGIELFTCGACGARSAHPRDIESGYCNRCHTFPEGRTGGR